MPIKENYIIVLSKLKSIGKVFHFTNKFNTADEYFEHYNQLTYLASLTLMTNIGEQSTKISNDFKNRFNTINWNQTKGLRNFIVHNKVWVSSFYLIQ